MIVLVDTKRARGGGQVVLEELCRRLHGSVTTRVLCKQVLATKLRLPEGARAHVEVDDVVGDLAHGERIVLVSNANASLPATWKAARRLRAGGHQVSTVAIVHNYPSTWLKLLATRFWLSRIDSAIVVEPGLARLRRDAHVPAWLSVENREAIRPLEADPIAPGRVLCFARPDRTKGLHLLPSIFSELTSAGIHCEVALGAPLDGDRSYELELRKSLAGWLVEGHRGPDWIAPGDIFIVPSISGEAACLAAQEVMARGAVVVASRIGLMGYLSPAGVGVRTFPSGDMKSAVRAVLSLVELMPEEFDAECRGAADQIASRAGRWYDDVVDLLMKDAT